MREKSAIASTHQRCFQRGLEKAVSSWHIKNNTESRNTRISWWPRCRRTGCCYTRLFFFFFSAKRHLLFCFVVMILLSKVFLVNKQLLYLSKTLRRAADPGSCQAIQVQKLILLGGATFREIQKGPVGKYVGSCGKPEELKRSLLIADYYIKTGFTRSLESIGGYGNNSKELGKKKEKKCTHNFLLPGLINRAVASHFSSSKIPLLLCQSCFLTLKNCNSLQVVTATTRKVPKYFSCHLYW